MSTTTPTTDLDPDGDLIMTIGSGSNVVRFRVSRTTLRLASPLWKAKLVGASHGGTANEVRMLHDSPEHMRAVLLLAHLQAHAPVPDGLPRDMALDNLAEVSKLCAKYQCEGAARDRMYIWMIPHNSHPIDSVESASHWMWIGWTFGWRASFMAAFVYLFNTSTPASMEVFPKLPKGCKDFLVQAANTRMNALLDKAYTTLAKLLNHQIACSQASTTLSRAPANASNSTRCTLLLLGTLTRFFTTLNLPLDLTRRPRNLDITFSMHEAAELADHLGDDLHEELTGVFHEECLGEVEELLAYVEALGAHQDARLDAGTEARFAAEEARR